MEVNAYEVCTFSDNREVCSVYCCLKETRSMQQKLQILFRSRGYFTAHQVYRNVSVKMPAYDFFWISHKSHFDFSLAIFGQHNLQRFHVNDFEHVHDAWKCCHCTLWNADLLHLIKDTIASLRKYNMPFKSPLLWAVLHECHDTGVGTGPADTAAAGPIIWQTGIFMFTLYKLFREPWSFFLFGHCRFL